MFATLAVLAALALPPHWHPHFPIGGGLFGHGFGGGVSVINAGVGNLGSNLVILNGQEYEVIGSTLVPVQSVGFGVGALTVVR